MRPNRLGEHPLFAQKSSKPEARDALPTSRPARLLLPVPPETPPYPQQRGGLSLSPPAQYRPQPNTTSHPNDRPLWPPLRHEPWLPPPPRSVASVQEVDHPQHPSAPAPHDLFNPFSRAGVDPQDNSELRAPLPGSKLRIHRTHRRGATEPSYLRHVLEWSFIPRATTSSDLQFQALARRRIVDLQEGDAEAAASESRRFCPLSGKEKSSLRHCYSASDIPGEAHQEESGLEPRSCSLDDTPPAQRTESGGSEDEDHPLLMATRARPQSGLQQENCTHRLQSKAHLQPPPPTDTVKENRESRTPRRLGPLVSSPKMTQPKREPLQPTQSQGNKQPVPSPLPPNLASHGDLRASVNSALLDNGTSILRIQNVLANSLEASGWNERAEKYMQGAVREGKLSNNEIVAKIKEEARKGLFREDSEAGWEVGKGHGLGGGDGPAEGDAKGGGSGSGSANGGANDLAIPKGAIDAAIKGLREELGRSCEVVEERDWEY